MSTGFPRPHSATWSRPEAVSSLWWEVMGFILSRIAAAVYETAMRTAGFDIPDEAATARFGARLAALLAPGDVVGLRGDLGAGKTFLAAAVARALGVPPKVPVTSPTFTLVNEYPGGRLPVFHMDLYRLASPAELHDLGLREYYDGAGVCLVEWCDRFADLWPGGALVLALRLGEGTARRIEAEGEGRGAELVAGLLAGPGVA